MKHFRQLLPATAFALLCFLPPAGAKAAADKFQVTSLVAQRMVPPPSGWDHFVEVLNSFGMSLPVQGNFHPSVILMLKK